MPHEIVIGMLPGTEYEVVLRERVEPRLPPRKEEEEMDDPREEIDFRSRPVAAPDGPERRRRVFPFHLYCAHIY